MTDAKIVPDLKVAQLFLDTLDPNGKFTFKPLTTIKTAKMVVWQEPLTARLKNTLQPYKTFSKKAQGYLSLSMKPT